MLHRPHNHGFQLGLFIVKMALGRFFCLYLIGTLHATTDHRELVPEEGRLVFLSPNGIRIVFNKAFEINRFLISQRDCVHD